MFPTRAPVVFSVLKVFNTLKLAILISPVFAAIGAAGLGFSVVNESAVVGCRRYLSKP